MICLWLVEIAKNLQTNFPSNLLKNETNGTIDICQCIYMKCIQP